MKMQNLELKTLLFVISNVAILNTAFAQPAQIQDFVGKYKVTDCSVWRSHRSIPSSYEVVSTGVAIMFLPDGELSASQGKFFFYDLSSDPESGVNVKVTDSSILNHGSSHEQGVPFFASPIFGVRYSWTQSIEFDDSSRKSVRIRNKNCFTGGTVMGGFFCVERAYVDCRLERE